MYVRRYVYNMNERRFLCTHVRTHAGMYVHGFCAYIHRSIQFLSHYQMLNRSLHPAQRSQVSRQRQEDHHNH